MKNKIVSPSAMESYGENVFSIKTMRNYLSEKAYKSLASTICSGQTLDPKIADEVADAMKTWAVEKGATHFSHWFQPLTGTTAEKHEAFIAPDNEGGCIVAFSGKELIQGEPDASSFPSGGLRVTFEARGYTAWDPSSPAFIREGENGATLCIPTIFCGYHGEALDKKTPLLRSREALSKQVCRLGKLFGVKATGTRAYATLGPEQEYFLIDKAFYDARLDLIQTGRTLFGRTPAKHQQMEDHYFGTIKPRVVEFMCDLDAELWKLGVPARTRHNEVSPAQFEIAPVYEEQNLAVDHNMLVMAVLKEVAEKHGFVCLLHEKPYAGVNGSGKHNNWAVAGPDGKNWLQPGDNPHENAKFLTVIVALVAAVDKHADLLRAAVASAGNDHRLGANEAPPAIMSVFLGDQLTDIMDQIEKAGEAKTSKKGGAIVVGVSHLPELPRDATDRNRTSPFAFTGNKFEFRAVGSSQSCAGANIVINTMVADVLDDMCTELEKAGKAEFNKALQALLSRMLKKHKRVIFNGDNYSDAWKKEAKRRGLSNMMTTPESLKAIVAKENIEMFERHHVLSERETHSRYDVYMEAYEKTIHIESGVALTIARTMILPAAVRYLGELSDVKSSGTALKGLAKSVNALVDDLIKAAASLEKAAKGGRAADILGKMAAVRAVVDKLEAVIPDDLWPLPTYAEMMFMM